jgi:hypothetical protein
MQIYEVRISHDALRDMARIRTFLLEMMSEDGAVAHDISEMSHREPAWQQHLHKNETIPFSEAFTLCGFVNT